MRRLGTNIEHEHFIQYIEETVNKILGDSNILGLSGSVVPELQLVFFAPLLQLPPDLLETSEMELNVMFTSEELYDTPTGPPDPSVPGMNMGTLFVSWLRIR